MSALILTSAFCLLTSAFGLGLWHGVYDDSPIAVHITSNRKVFHVGDTFRLIVTATNTSDRDVLLKRDWKEQLVCYDIAAHDIAGGDVTQSSSIGIVSQAEQVEWPGRVLTATRMDSADVVRLRPNESHTVNREVRAWTADDVATFSFRLKLVGAKDLSHNFDMWHGVAWSNAVTLTVRP